MTKNELKILPKGLNLLTNMEILSLSDNKLQLIPDEIGTLMNLRTLSVENNALKNLPDTLANCTKLESLYLRGNKIKKIPKVILHFNLKAITGIKGFDRGKTNTAFLKFLQTLHKSTLPVSDKEKIFHLFVDNKVAIKKNLNLKNLLDSLAFKNEVVRSRAIGYLLNWSGSTLAENPIKKGDEVFLIGDTNLKKKTIKTRLEKNGISYTAEVKYNTSCLR